MRSQPMLFSWGQECRACKKQKVINSYKPRSVQGTHTTLKSSLLSSARSNAFCLGCASSFNMRRRVRKFMHPFQHIMFQPKRDNPVTEKWNPCLSEFILKWIYGEEERRRLWNSFFWVQGCLEACRWSLPQCVLRGKCSFWDKFYYIVPS